MVVPRDALKGLLHFRHNLSYRHYGEAIKFPYGNLYQSPFLTLLFFSWHVDLTASEVQIGHGEV